MKLSSSQQRVVTGLTLVAVLAAVLAAGGWTMRLAMVLVACLGLFEFFNLYWPGVHTGRKIAGILLGACIVLSQALGPLWTVTVTALVLPAAGLLFLFNYGRGNPEARLGHYAPLIHGLLYIPVILQLGLYLSPAEQCLALLAAIATDTGGYYAGTSFGKHKIWPSVSPKKSWEGFFGGLVLCVLVCTLLGLTGEAMAWSLPRLPWWGWLLVGTALQQAALFGDFFESALKRSLDVKDSGTILPGHGGILDRIDSILFVLPVYMLIRLAVG